MRIHAITCVKNEVSRYLDSFLTWHVKHFDSFFVYDDASTDDSLKVLSWHPNVTVVQRDDAIPSFLQHEGKFRQAAFNAFVRRIDPQPGDWVMALDSDEFAVSDYSDLHGALKFSCQAAEDANATSLEVHIPEVWSISPVQVRVDGFWGGLSSPRVWRYIPPAEFAQRAMGGGCWPTYVNELKKHPCSLVKILHYGYADPADREAKYERYTSLDHGHSSTHIQSIVKPAQTVAWSGTVPRVWRGIYG